VSETGEFGNEYKKSEYKKDEGLDWDCHGPGRILCAVSGCGGGG
jgi:hypothetical protein